MFRAASVLPLTASRSDRPAENDFGKEDLHEILNSAIEGLPPAYRAVFALHEQIAEADAAREASSQAAEKQKTIEEDLQRCDLVERALVTRR